jgi:hypothetical protein
MRVSCLEREGVDRNDLGRGSPAVGLYHATKEPSVHANLPPQPHREANAPTLPQPKSTSADLLCLAYAAKWLPFVDFDYCSRTATGKVGRRPKSTLQQEIVVGLVNPRSPLADHSSCGY